MTDIKALVSGSQTILDEYQKNTHNPEVAKLWMDWDSDWEHDANWQVLPVYVSEGILAERYGGELDWRDNMLRLWSYLAKTWDLTFSCFDLDRVDLVAFSRLRGGETLKEHSHDNKGHLIFHMGVEIPHGDVGITTSFGKHQWKEPQEWVLFDDNENHSAWNRTPDDRVIFYVDFLP